MTQLTLFLIYPWDMPDISVRNAILFRKWRNYYFELKEYLTFAFYETFWNCIQNWTNIVKEAFWFDDSLENHEMATFRPNDSLTLTFHETFSKSIPKWISFVKEVFWFNALFRKWRDDCIVKA